MSPQFHMFNKAFPTPATPEAVVVRVDGGHVPSHYRPQIEPGRTEGAAVGSLSRVGSHMQGEVVTPYEPGRAHVALVVLHTIVGFHMCSVIRYMVKSGATLITPADHLPCVDAFVDLQVTTLGERLPAGGTDVRPESTMCPAVSGQITLLSKRLATVVTDEWPLLCVFSPMNNNMTLIVRGVLAPLTLVSAVPADVAVTLLHVFVQMILF